MRVRVNGGGHVAQIYAIRQAISKALVSYYQKCKWKIIYILFRLAFLKIFWFIFYRCWRSQQERNQRYFNSVW